MRLLHIKRIEIWLNNANTWILLASRCDHDLKFIGVFNKNNKSLIYYITKTFIYISHMYFLLQSVVQKIKTINENSNITMIQSTKVNVSSYII